MHYFICILKFIPIWLAIAFASMPANAQNDNYSRALEMSSGAYNSNVQGIITGGVGGTYIQIGLDLSKLLAEKTQLRMIPMIGAGSATNILDLLKRYGVDFAIVQSDVIAHIEYRYPGNKEVAKLAYVSKIYNEEIHLVGRANDGPKSIADLAGRRVNIGSNGSGTQITSRLLLDFLNIDVEQSTLSNTDALKALKEGKIDAMIFVAGRPASLLSSIKPEDNLALLAIPFLPSLSDTYARAEFEPQDYPNLISGKFVPTISVGAILIVYDNFVRQGERYANVVNFVQTFFSNIDTLRDGPYHPKWKEIDIRAEVPGWKRFEAAKNLLNRGLAPARN